MLIKSSISFTLCSSSIKVGKFLENCNVKSKVPSSYATGRPCAVMMHEAEKSDEQYREAGHASLHGRTHLGQCQADFACRRLDRQLALVVLAKQCLCLRQKGVTNISVCESNV